MENKDKKQVILRLIKPYFEDRSKCVRSERGFCQYLTSDGKKCVAGSAMTDEFLERLDREDLQKVSIQNILNRYPQSDVFKPEYVGVLTPEDWRLLQYIHDDLSMPNSLPFTDHLCAIYGIDKEELGAPSA